MRAVEFEAELSQGHTLTVPDEIAAALPQGQPVRVVLLVPESDNDRPREASAAVDSCRRNAAGHASCEPRDEWERRLLAAATDCSVSLPHSAVGSEGLYE